MLPAFTQFAASLGGFLPMLLHGVWVTLQLALLSLLLGLILGLLGAGAKLSRVRAWRLCAQVYTTLIRGVPDLLLMLLIFYGLQTGLSRLTSELGWAYIDVDPFSAGVITLGFIYGAYFTETFRGALLAVPRGQFQAAKALGLTFRQSFVHVIFPQMMRFALPGLGNNWMVLLKATALVSIIGLADLVKVAQMAGKSSQQLLAFLLLAALVYLLLSSVSNAALRWLERRYGDGVQESSS
ncbi:MAG: amino acid ABC transporter permease [Pseudomonadales bacterium RIFCSPLOWO2_12_60_38]|uniref:ABC transmembrane type-1 domain-containing protein n=1 Tax=Pseudomonas syringae pv. avii TaxID=663959 RepID=A0A3M5W970_PSESX|nr:MULTISPECIES: ABC transporter permease subunit [Pseudomonas]AFJ57946.1 lysine/arginine/ornithine ABC transporter, permease protein HisQ [Pseudomonas fluorescens A506]AOS75850.1 amino acid ABC transporter permease [Pseudomonas fluorescens]ETK38370.1 histidine/lysine/arginine/ornithine ABC transporter permease HisQ [Pseudomonas fluorescens FH5]MDN5398982.1 ABC transporter permease subunit [Pseudomonas sp.]MDN5420134.1 ABC transporter permease subunit [Pseudomonadales bacterium]OHC31381.1 MAG